MIAKATHNPGLLSALYVRVVTWDKALNRRALDGMTIAAGAIRGGGEIEPLSTGEYLVMSRSGRGAYVVTPGRAGGCTCADAVFGGAPHGYCAHRIAAWYLVNARLAADGQPTVELTA